jgi:hypothetical protein
MLARKVLALAFAGALLAGCGASAVPGANAASGASAASGANAASIVNQRLASPLSSPTIKKVTPIQAEQTQTIVIKGKGFGKMKPYDGDSCCVEISVTNPACYYYGSYDVWNAGWSGGTKGANEVTLNVTKWDNKKIVIAGFTGSYGYSCWTLNAGDAITINVWNAQTEAGPATWSGTIQ